MGLQFAEKVQEIGETLRYSMHYRPGGGIAEGDSLTGSYSAKVWEWEKGVTGAEKTSTMLDSIARVGNRVYVWIKLGTAGKKYKITFYSDTTFGEKAVEADLIVTFGNN